MIDTQRKERQEGGEAVRKGEEEGLDGERGRINMGGI